MACISIREYDHLLPEGAGIYHPRARTVSAASFGALLRAVGRDPETLGQALRPSALLGRPSIQAQSFAGVIRTPDGTEIEVLPKVLYLSESEDKVESARALLITMLRTVPDMDLIDPGPAGLRLRHLPLFEFFIFQLLRAVTHVVHRGIRHDYTALGNSEPFIRGRILFAEQIRRNLGRQQFCHNEHDQFLPDCAENRLLKSALAVVLDLTRSSRNQQLARELSFCFDEVPCSRDIGADVQACRRDPSMSHYRRAVAWAALILEKMRPSPTAGRREVQSVLFAMEDLFECYVFAKLRAQCLALGSSFKVRRQLKGQFLARHQNRSMFLLKPDLSLDWNGKAVRILDTKWKLLNAVSGEVRTNKYGVSQSDIYQLFAYGRKYLRDESEKIVCLIYPRTSVFPSPLPHFEIEQDLRLYVLPFDIERGELLGLDAIQIH